MGNNDIANEQCSCLNKKFASTDFLRSYGFIKENILFDRNARRGSLCVVPQTKSLTV